MPSRDQDPTEPMRQRASSYAGVDEGTACTQSSFKAGKRSFFFVGMQGGRYKAMFKLQRSLPEAERLAAKQPDNYEVGSTAWVTARFTAEKPMPRKVWEKWLDESYELSAGAATSKKIGGKKIGGKKTGNKKASRKKTTGKKTAKKAGKKKSSKKASSKKRAAKKKAAKARSKRG